MSSTPSPSSAASTESSTKRERRKQARPGELIDAALTLFVEKGFAATRAEEVAARAGVSKGTLFLYFQTKEDLFREVIRTRLVDHFLAWDQEYESAQGSSEDLLRYSLQTWWERIGSTPAGGLTKLVLSESHNFPEIAKYYRDSVVHPGQQLLRKIMVRGISQGEFRPVDVDHAVMSLVSAMVFVVTWKHAMSSCTPPGESFDPVSFLQAHLDLLLRGLRSESPTPHMNTPKPTNV